MKKNLLSCFIILAIVSIGFMGCRSKSVAIEASEPEVIQEAVPEVVKEDFSGKLIGKWKMAEVAGQKILTENVIVSTYNCDGTMINSRINQFWEKNDKWNYTADGKLITMVRPADNEMLNIVLSSVDENELIYESVTPVKNPGRADDYQGALKMVKVNADYADAIIGLWEVTFCQEDDSVKAGNCRFEYNGDETYRYYEKNDKGEFVSDGINEYLLDGDWLAKRWIKDGKENRGAWNIQSCDETEMVLTAVCQGKDGSLYEKKRVLNRVLDRLEK